MRTLGVVFALAVSLLHCGVLAIAAAQDVSSPLTVEEAKLRFHLLPQPVLELPVLNSTNKSISGKFRLSLLNFDDDSVAAAISGAFIETPGETVEKIAWPVEHLPSVTPTQLGWYRLQYSFEPEAESGMPPARGIVQLGPLLTDGFGVSIAAAARVAPGSKYPVRLHVENPLTHRPCTNTPVGVVLEFGNDEDTDVKRNTKTDAAGNATVVFTLPQAPSDQDGTVTATVARGPFSEEAKLDFAFPDKPAPGLTITTDKPLYQPGQTVHVRLFAIDSDRRAMAGAKLDLEIDDEEGSEQFHERLTASRFGIASADWDIPKKLQLGDFTITAKFDSSENNYWAERRSDIRISRYELPTFTVSVDPDRTYYLPGSDAVVDVHADYLFGKPVQHGKVRIVRQENRHWDYAKQKWLADESGTVEGELGSGGHFKGTIRLANDFKTFKESDSDRFQDVTLAAYLTDSSTGRTEQRRFKIRITAQPIHLYFVGSDGARRNQPSVLYVTSSYADGTPVSASGKIFAAQPTNDETFQNGFDLGHRRQVGTFHTNRFGIGRAELSPLQEKDIRIPVWYFHQRNNYFGYYNRASGEEPTERIAWLVAEAHDSKGLNGEYDQQLSVSPDDPFLQVQTGQTLYHPGDAIQVTLNSNSKIKDATLSVWSEQGLLSSQMVTLDRGHATATVGYDPRFLGDIFLTASSMAPATDQEKSLTGWAQILYPARKELEVKVKLPQTTFKPGEEVSANVHVLTPQGRSTESALGVLVFDRAVAERVRTDEDFGRGYGYSIFDYFGWDYERSIAGVSYRDLLDLDASKPFPEGLDLLAEGMLHAESVPWMADDSLEGGGWDALGASNVFGKWIQKKIEPARKAMNDWYKANGEYPSNDAGFQTALRAKGLDSDRFRDPWGNPFFVKSYFTGTDHVVELVSSGVDKKPGTKDDFVVATFQWPYFRKIGMKIDESAAQYFSATGNYIRDCSTLKDELRKKGIDLDALRDPWGRAYSITFDISGPYFRVLVESAGPDGFFDSKAKASWDDVEVWVSNLHYFINENAALNSALADNFKTTGSFPQNEEQLKPILALAKLDPQHLLDPWGHPYRFNFSEHSHYSDMLTVHDVRVYSDPSRQSKKVTEAIPVTQKVAYLNVLSDGPKHDPNQAFSVAEFSRVLVEQTSKDKSPVAAGKQKPLAGDTGGIYGEITDPTGAAVANADVTAISADTGQVFTTQADYAGAYALLNLPPGFYQLECTYRGFRRNVVQRVPVQLGFSTKVDVTLNVGSVSETVEVTATSPTLQTDSTAMVSSIRRTPSTPAEKPLFTPRLRKYFPETLVWRPEVITDKHGRAQIDFQMADNITAWKMSVLASNEAGQVGIAEKDLRSFQPFFLESDPPKTFTTGDQISLPVVLRNYTAAPLTVSTEMQPAPWFTILSAAKQDVTVPANGDATSLFTFRADRADRNAKQRVTARNSDAGDAVEHELVVHPDGQEISFSSSRILAGERNSIDVQIPENAIPGSMDAELRIYPNLLAHVLDAMHGIGELPAGCAEQVTSTSYISLMALQLLQKGLQDNPDSSNPRAVLAAEARATVQEGYDQLANLQGTDGGFGYWKGMTPNVALTAYVLRFLNLAKDFIDVDGAIRRRARDYLVARQAKSGAWTSYSWNLKHEADDPNLTAYVARALAGMKADPKAKDPDKQKLAQASLKSALDFLEARIDSWSDAYLAGNYAIAAVESARPEHMQNAESVLRSLAHREGDTTYWNLEANTSPFYGWGFAGRLETTALAVNALSKLQTVRPDHDNSEMISRGLQYLLTHKDRYYIWYSTQATQNVLEAMIAALPPAAETDSASEAVLKMNGRVLRSIPLPKPQDVVGPVTIPLPGDFKKGANQIEISRSGSAAAMNASIVSSYYIPWSQSEASAQEAFKRGETRALRLKVLYDRNELRLGDTVHCSVEAERIGFRGYGMMLAEVGLPPGAEVDRSSLENAKISPGVSGYEVQPDKVVFYLWPTAGGTSFAFDFRMRYRIKAMTAASILYDYYNPDANATVAPVRFTVN
jgi:A-macroglobulin TED domain/Alpha-2-macroglobulin family/MG2 domain/Carboxypeptidase regulatory-like domain/A-macroglobulin receptor binding domain/Macroglobulin domain MG3/Alpha-2-macroglobulin bait region domain